MTVGHVGATPNFVRRRRRSIMFANLRRRMAVAVVLIAIPVGFIVTTEAPAMASCLAQDHWTTYSDTYFYSSPYQYVPTNTSCHDVNVSYVNWEGEWSAWWWNGSYWAFGSGGWLYLYAGYQSPWVVFIRNINRGTAVKMAFGFYNAYAQVQV